MRAAATIALAAWLMAGSASSEEGALQAKVASPAEIQAYFRSTGKQVTTFVGYSGTGYEDPAAMLAQAERVLEALDPDKTLVNIGATPDGIGAVYELAKRRGFATTGIVSTQAKEHGVALSPFVDRVFFVEDAAWGGLVEGTDRLTPTSAAMVDVSDEVVGIGGGEAARAELLGAKRAGRRVRFFPADMNHEKARADARKKRLPAPTDFRGAAHSAFVPE
jgi:hypothetical protein